MAKDLSALTEDELHECLRKLRRREARIRLELIIRKRKRLREHRETAELLGEFAERAKTDEP